MLDVFAWGMETLTRPTLQNLLAGYDEFEHRRQVDRLLHRLQQRKLVARSRTGRQVFYRLTAAGAKRLPVDSPHRAWDRKWDRVWRVFTFDVPEARRKDRVRLWQALRAHKLGLLQRSVWIWPHNVEPILASIIEAEGVPECFCGFEVRRLFLCSDREVVESSWDFEEIGRHHRSYLQQLVATTGSLDRVGTHAELAAAARTECQAYRLAFFFDPLLPRALWPRRYAGPAVHEGHERFRHRLRERLVAMAAE